MSEELCPSSADTPVPLPFFVRTSNQVLCVGVLEAVPSAVLCLAKQCCALSPRMPRIHLSSLGKSLSS